MKPFVTTDVNCQGVYLKVKFLKMFSSLFYVGCRAILAARRVIPCVSVLKVLDLLCISLFNALSILW